MKLVIEVSEEQAVRIRAALLATVAQTPGVRVEITDEFVVAWLKNHLRNLTIGYENDVRATQDATTW